MNRRGFLGILAGAAALAAVPTMAWAENQRYTYDICMIIGRNAMAKWEYPDAPVFGKMLIVEDPRHPVFTKKTDYTLTPGYMKPGRSK